MLAGTARNAAATSAGAWWKTIRQTAHPSAPRTAPAAAPPNCSRTHRARMLSLRPTRPTRSRSTHPPRQSNRPCRPPSKPPMLAPSPEGVVRAIDRAFATGHDVIVPRHAPPPPSPHRVVGYLHVRTLRSLDPGHGTDRLLRGR